MAHCKPRADSVESGRADSGNSPDIFDRGKRTIDITVGDNSLSQRGTYAFQLHPVDPGGFVDIHSKTRLKLSSALQQQRIRSARRDNNPFDRQPHQQHRQQHGHHASILRPKSEDDGRWGVCGRIRNGGDRSARVHSERLIAAFRQGTTPQQKLRQLKVIRLRNMRSEGVYSLSATLAG